MSWEPGDGACSEPGGRRWEPHLGLRRYGRARGAGRPPPDGTGTSGGGTAGPGPGSREGCAKAIVCLIINSADAGTLQSVKRALHGNYSSCAEGDIKTDGKDCTRR